MNSLSKGTCKQNSHNERITDMALKIKYEKGTPPHKGYYLVLWKHTIAFGREKDKYPDVMYWNGNEWQTESDDDAFKMPGNEKPLTFSTVMIDEYCEVIV